MGRRPGAAVSRTDVDGFGGDVAGDDGGEELLEPCRQCGNFAGEQFVEVTDELPELRHVQHRNVVRIAVREVEGVRRPTLQVFSAIDNLMKGAAGQALQNANLMLGLDESAGLR